MNKKIVLRGLLVFFAVPAFAEEGATLHPAVPKEGDVCTYRMTDKLYGKNEMLKVFKTTAIAVSPDGSKVMWDREVIERGSANEPVGHVTRNFQNSYGWPMIEGRSFTPYTPLLGESAKNGPDITPNAKLGDVEYTFTYKGDRGTTKMTGKVSNWEEMTVPAGKFHVLALNWQGYYSLPLSAQGVVAQGSTSVSYTIAKETPCIVTTLFKEEESRGGYAQAVLTELVSYETK